MTSKLTYGCCEYDGWLCGYAYTADGMLLSAVGGNSDI